MIESMGGADAAGLRVVAFSSKRLLWAAEEVSALPVTDRMALKVRAGEHLAAIVVTACLGQRPSGVDRSGQADLSFTAVSAERTHGLVPAGDQAVEVKSIGSAFRRYEAISAVGDHHELVVESAASLLADAQPALNRAASQLRSKSVDGRHIFLVVHPLERMVAEVIANPFTVGAALGPIELPHHVDSLWVLFHPDQVVIYSRAQAAWTQIMFAPDGEEDSRVEDLAMLQQAEDTFLAALPGSATTSPFLYVMRVAPTDE